MSELVRFLSGDNDVAQKTQMDPQNPTAKFVPLEPGQVLFGLEVVEDGSLLGTIYYDYKDKNGIITRVSMGNGGAGGSGGGGGIIKTLATTDGKHESDEVTATANTIIPLPKKIFANLLSAKTQFNFPKVHDPSNTAYVNEDAAPGQSYLYGNGLHMVNPFNTLQDSWIRTIGKSGSAEATLELAMRDNASNEYIYDQIVARHYKADGTIVTDTDGHKREVVILGKEGESQFPGPVTSQRGFVGDVDGNAKSATKAKQDWYDQVIDSTYLSKIVKTTHNGSKFEITSYDGRYTPVGSADAKKDVITIPGATTTLAGLVTTGDQTITGNKTINSSGTLTIMKQGGFIYSGIQEDKATNKNLPIWFSTGTANGTPNYSTELTYNPSTGTVTAKKFAGPATSATYDAEGGAIHDKYLKRAGGTMTGALKFADNIYNAFGDDVEIGSQNVAGKLNIHGKNGATGIVFVPYSGSTSQTISIDGAGVMTITGTVKTTLKGNADTATKLKTARNFNITDSSAAYSGPNVSFDGTADVTLHMPDTFAGALKGNADTATKLATARTLWGQSFNGTANISGNMTGVGNVTSTKTNTYTLGTSSNLWKAVYATTFYGALSGNANTATKLQTARSFHITDSSATYNGVSATFDGSAAITLHMPDTFVGTLKGHADSSTRVTISDGSSDAERKILVSSDSTSGQNVYAVPGITANYAKKTLTAAGGFIGNASSASKLQTAKKFTITDSSAAYTGTSASFDGTGDVTLHMPETFAGALKGNADTATKLATARTLWGQSFNGTANISGNMSSVGNVLSTKTNTYTIGSSSNVWKAIYATAFYGALSGNASSATKLATARTFHITDSSATYNGANVSFNGTGDVTLHMPSTFAGTLKGNADTATSAKALTSYVSIDQNQTVAQAKTQLRNKFKEIGYKVGAIVVPGSYVAQWNDDSKSFYASHVNSFISLNPGYDNYNYGHFLVAQYGSNNLCHIGLNSGAWTVMRVLLDSSNYTSYTVRKDGTGATGTWGISITGNAATATQAQSALKDGDLNEITTTYLKKSGGTMTGALNFANGTYNKMGDDVEIGDKNTAGKLYIHGLNGTTGIVFAPYSGSTSQTLSIDGAGVMTITGTLKATLSGNASTATTLKTARNFHITDSSATYNGPNASFNGSADVTLHMPSTFAGTLKGNADSATIARSLGTDNGMKMYAHHGNEINFGGTTTSTTLYFGYRATDSRPIPAKFVFGGSTGTATLVAATFQGALSGNATSATKLQTARNFHITDSSATYNGPNASFNGTADITLHMPSTFAGSLKGNADTATNADKLDGYHRKGLYTSPGAWINANGYTKTVTVNGDKDTYYPVVISTTSEKEAINYISVWKNLGSKTAAYSSGNHPDGTSSMWLIYEARSWIWDGNGGYLKCWYYSMPYANLCAKAEQAGSGVGSLVVYLRGGGTSYNISTTYNASVNVYLTATNIGSSTYPVNVAPTTSNGNLGKLSTVVLGYGNLEGNAATTTKWQTARNFQVDLALDNPATVKVDGTKDVILPVTGILATKHGGTGQSSHTANRLVWSETATKLSATNNHYVNASKIAVNYTSAPSTNFYVNGTSYLNGNTTINGQMKTTGPLLIGSDANGRTKNYIAFYGITGDGPDTWNHTFIGENLFGDSDKSELILFKGNDPGSTPEDMRYASGPGPDRIRHIAAGHLFQIYRTALSGTFATIAQSTVPISIFEVNQQGVVVYNEGTDANNYPAKITFKVKDTVHGTTSTATIAAYSDHGTASYGSNLVISSGGNTLIQAGDGAYGSYANLIGTGVNQGENLYLTADGSIQLCAIADTANRKLIWDGTTFYPSISNTFHLGGKSYRWASAHVYRDFNIYGTESTSDESHVRFNASDNSQRAIIAFNGNTTNTLDATTHLKIATNYGDIRLDAASNYINVKGHILPRADFTATNYNIGSTTRRWGNVYANALRLQGPSSDPSEAQGARIEFAYDNGGNRSQPVYISYTPNDGYRAPYGLKIFGTEASNYGAWLEVQGAIGTSNTNASSGIGLSLYGGPVNGKPTYGMFFGGTATFGKLYNTTSSSYGVSSDLATYFTTSDTTNRGWLFMRGATNVAGVTGNGTFLSIVSTGTHIAGNQGKVIIDGTAGAGYNMLFRQKSTNGVFTGGAYNAEWNLYYTANSVITAGTNGTTYGIRLMNEAGNTRLNRLGINGENTGYQLYVNGKSYFNGVIATNSQISSSVATGTPPFVIASTTVNANLNADLLDGFHESKFLRHRDTVSGSGGTSHSNSLWAQIGIRQYNNALPDAMGNNATYAYGAVVSLPGANSRLDLWYNHQTSSNGNGLRYRTGWNDDKQAWATILDSVNYGAIADGRYVNVTGDTMTGLLSITTHGVTTTYGCQNALYSHNSTNASVGHWFNKNVYVQGNIYAGSSYSDLVLTTANYAGQIDGRYVNVTGDTMSGALNFANGTWNKVGDDAYFGDNNTAGSFAIKGMNGNTNLKMVTYGGTTYGTITWNGSTFLLSHRLYFSNAGTWATTVNYANSLINFGTRFNNQSSGTLYYFPWMGGYDGVNGAGYYNTVTMGLYHGVPSNAGFFIGMSWDGNNADTFYYFSRTGDFTAPRVRNAVWNDYAECRAASTEEPGRVVIETSTGIMRKSTDRLQAGASVVSDTYGTLMGETELCKTPIAVAGRVLVYTYEDRDSYPLGAAVCTGPNGTVSLMTREEVREYPERIVGTVSEIPKYETWGTGNVKVNGRIWIKVR